MNAHHTPAVIAKKIAEAAKKSAYIRQDDQSEWLRIDSVDDVGDEFINAHDENAMRGGDRTLIIAELDPIKVEFLMLSKYKLEL